MLNYIHTYFIFNSYSYSYYGNTAFTSIISTTLLLITAICMFVYFKSSKRFQIYSMNEKEYANFNNRYNQNPPTNYPNTIQPYSPMQQMPLYPSQPYPNTQQAPAPMSDQPAIPPTQIPTQQQPAMQPYSPLPYTNYTPQAPASTGWQTTPAPAPSYGNVPTPASQVNEINPTPLTPPVVFNPHVPQIQPSEIIQQQITNPYHPQVQQNREDSSATQKTMPTYTSPYLSDSSVPSQENLPVSTTPTYSKPVYTSPDYESQNDAELTSPISTPDTAQEKTDATNTETTSP